MWNGSFAFADDDVDSDSIRTELMGFPEHSRNSNTANVSESTRRPQRLSQDTALTRKKPPPRALSPKSVQADDRGGLRLRLSRLLGRNQQLSPNVTLSQLSALLHRQRDCFKSDGQSRLQSNRLGKHRRHFHSRKAKRNWKVAIRHICLSSKFPLASISSKAWFTGISGWRTNLTASCFVEKQSKYTKDKTKAVCSVDSKRLMQEITWRNNYWTLLLYHKAQLWLQSENFRTLVHAPYLYMREICLKYLHSDYKRLWIVRSAWVMLKVLRTHLLWNKLLTYMRDFARVNITKYSDGIGSTEKQGFLLPAKVSNEEKRAKSWPQKRWFILISTLLCSICKRTCRTFYILCWQSILKQKLPKVY